MKNFKYKHGLCIMRAQPFHVGHQRIVDKMLKDCEYVTVALGSIQEHGTQRNPLNYSLRKKMIQNVYRENEGYSRLKIVGLFDINNPVEWPSFVVDFVVENFSDLGRPDVYYAGSEYDAHWFKGVIDKIEYVDRVSQDFPFVSATMVREMIKFGDARWKNYVDSRNYKIIEDAFNLRKAVV